MKNNYIDNRDAEDDSRSQEVEDLRKDRDKWKERELNMQVNCNRELEELNKVRKERDQLRERNRVLEEALTKLENRLMNPDLRKIVTAALSSNESNINDKTL